MKEIESFMELYAWCWADEETTARPGITDRVHCKHLYKVDRFVDEAGYFPYGVRLRDFNGNELTETFYMQQFTYFEVCMN